MREARTERGCHVPEACVADPPRREPLPLRAGRGDRQRAQPAEDQQRPGIHGRGRGAGVLVGVADGGGGIGRRQTGSFSPRRRCIVVIYREHFPFMPSLGGKLTS